MKQPNSYSDLTLTERRARFVYEACRLEALLSMRPIIPEPFDYRDITFQKQFREIIERICDDNAQATTPEEEHDSWLQAYKAMGWKYGPVRDVSAKTHPDMVTFHELPQLEREKDYVFLAMCQLARRFIR